MKSQQTYGRGSSNERRGGLATRVVTGVIALASALCGCGGAGEPGTGWMEGRREYGYPSAPQGKALHDVFPDLSWPGLEADETAPTTIATRAYFDPSGDRGVRALVVIVTALDCPSGIELAASVDGTLGDLRAKGVRALTIAMDGSRKVVENDRYTPFRSKVKQLDLAFALDFPGLEASPTTYLVDPRTMRVVQIHEGALPVPVLLREIDRLVEETRLDGK